MKSPLPMLKSKRRADTLQLIAMALMLIGSFFISTTDTRANTCQNVAGYYAIRSVIGENTCDEEIDPVNLEAEIIQNGCKAELDMGVSLNGHVVGNRVFLKGSYWWMGTTTKDVQLVIQGNQLSGTGNWTYSILGYSCKETETFSGSRL
jgi:hypothetical protein